MNILISGSSGLIGTQLVEFLKNKGHTISRLLRIPARIGENDILWDPLADTFNPELLRNFDTIIHLAGANIASWFWTERHKDKIKSSRINSTRILAESIASLDGSKPSLLCASATGYYGDRGASILNEGSPPGTGFLAGVVKEWERACQPAVDAGARVVNIRTGVVFSSQGGFLGRIVPVFKMGIGGKLGNGQQYLPWIHITDLIKVYELCLIDNTITGPVNAVATEPVSNEQFTATLARLLARPSFFTVPEFLLKIFPGEMAEELFLSSARVQPKVLQEKGFNFQFPNLASALTSALQ